MPHILPAGGQCPTQCRRGASSRLADQYDRLPSRKIGRVELRQGMIQGTRDVTAPKFMGLADINQNTFLLAKGLHQLIMLNGRDAR